MPAAWDTDDTAAVTLRPDLGTEAVSGTVATESVAELPSWAWLELGEARDGTRGVDRCDGLYPLSADHRGLCGSV